jgi:hypothetical protein
MPLSGTSRRKSLSCLIGLPKQKLLTQKDTELLGIEVKAKSVVEIDDGLAPCFFFKTEEGYTRCQCFDADRARTNCMEGWEEYNQEDIK